MGAWGPDIFDDDTAYDFVSEVGDDPLTFFRSSFETAIAKTYIEFDECHAVTVSAAHIDALLNGTAYRNDDQDVFDGWVAKHQGLAVDDLRPLAVQALERVLTSSELAELWSESPQFEIWKGHISALRDRLAK